MRLKQLSKAKSTNRPQPHKSPGPDGIEALFLRNIANEIAPMLTHLFQQSLYSGVLPLVWKRAYGSPIYKKGRSQDISPCFNNLTDMY